MKLHREISVNDRLPDFEGTHTVINADLAMFQATYDKEFSFHEEFTDCSGVTHWLEPVEIPTNEEIKNEANKRFLSNETHAFIQGAK